MPTRYNGRKHHLTIVTEYFGVSAGATGKVLHDLATGLAHEPNGLDVTVVTSRRSHLTKGAGHGARATELGSQESGIRTLTVGGAQRRDRSLAQRLVADAAFTLRAGKAVRHIASSIDVILVVTNPFLLPGAVRNVARARNAPYVYLVHDLYPDILDPMGVLPARHPLHKALHRAQTTWLRDAARVIVLGRCMRDRLRANYGVAERKLVTIPHHAEVNRSWSHAGTSAFRRTHGLDGFVVLYAGNIGRTSDVDTILDAALQVRDSHPHLQFVFVGQGERRPHLEARVAQDRLTNVKVVDYVAEADLHDLLRSADAHVTTLARGMEGMAVPLKTYHALASGRPVVAIGPPRSEGMRVVLEAGAGVHVENGRDDLLAKAVIRLASDPLHAGRLGQAAQNAARTMTRATSLAAYRSLLQAVLHEHGNRRDR